MDERPVISSIHVIATTPDGTRAALEAAALVATRQQARLVLLVPRTAADGEFSPHGLNWFIARFDKMSRAVKPPVQIRLCFSPNLKKAAMQMTPIGATVFLGGRTSVFWSSAEERLAGSLRRAGRSVVFVGCNGGGSWENRE